MNTTLSIPKGTTDRLDRNWPIAIGTTVVLGIASLYVWIAHPAFKDHVLFVLSTMPSEFLVTFVQHEPIILYYAKMHDPLLVAVLSLLGTLAVEVLNYNLAAAFARFRWMQSLLSHRSVKKASGYFMKAPFAVIFVAAITPIPFFPFRFLAPLSGYPMSRYLLALSVGRLPRFYFLSAFGQFLNLRSDVIMAMFVPLIVAAAVKVWRSRSKIPSAQTAQAANSLRIDRLAK